MLYDVTDFVNLTKLVALRRTGRPRGATLTFDRGRRTLPSARRAALSLEASLSLVSKEPHPCTARNRLAFSDELGP